MSRIQELKHYASSGRNKKKKPPHHILSVVRPKVGWDNRFHTESLPFYDCSHDEHLASWNSRTGARHRPPDDAANNSPLEGQMRKMMKAAEAEAIQSPSSPATQYAKQVTKKTLAEELAASKRRSAAKRRPNTAMAKLTSNSKHQTSCGATGSPVEGFDSLDNPISVPANDPFVMERLWTKSLARIKILWNELNVPKEERNVFARNCFLRVTAENLILITEEISRLLKLRKATLHVFYCVEAREATLKKLLEVVHKFDTKDYFSIQLIKQELVTIIEQLRFEGLLATESLIFWRSLCKVGQDLLWRGVSYLMKMQQDVMLFCNTSIGSLFGFQPHGNTSGSTSLLNQTAEDGSDGEELSTQEQHRPHSYEVVLPQIGIATGSISTTTLEALQMNEFTQRVLQARTVLRNEVEKCAAFDLSSIEAGNSTSFSKLVQKKPGQTELPLPGTLHHFSVQHTNQPTDSNTDPQSHQPRRDPRGGQPLHGEGDGFLDETQQAQQPMTRYEAMAGDLLLKDFGVSLPASQAVPMSNPPDLASSPEKTGASKIVDFFKTVVAGASTITSQTGRQKTKIEQENQAAEMLQLFPKENRVGTLSQQDNTEMSKVMKEKHAAALTIQKIYRQYKAKLTAAQRLLLLQRNRAAASIQQQYKRWMRQRYSSEHVWIPTNQKYRARVAPVTAAHIWLAQRPSKRPPTVLHFLHNQSKLNESNDRGGFNGIYRERRHNRTPAPLQIVKPRCRSEAGLWINQQHCASVKTTRRNEQTRGRLLISKVSRKHGALMWEWKKKRLKRTTCSWRTFFGCNLNKLYGPSTSVDGVVGSLCGGWDSLHRNSSSCKCVISSLTQCKIYEILLQYVVYSYHSTFVADQDKFCLPFWKKPKTGSAYFVVLPTKEQQSTKLVPHSKSTSVHGDQCVRVVPPLQPLKTLSTMKCLIQPQYRNLTNRQMNTRNGFSLSGNCLRFSDFISSQLNANTFVLVKLYAPQKCRTELDFKQHYSKYSKAYAPYALTIQLAWRCYVARVRTQEEQKMVQKEVELQTQLMKEAEMTEATLIIQHHWLKYVKARKQKNAAILLQTFARGWLSSTYMQEKTGLAATPAGSIVEEEEEEAPMVEYDSERDHFVTDLKPVNTAARNYSVYSTRQFGTSVEMPPLPGSISGTPTTTSQFKKKLMAASMTAESLDEWPSAEEMSVHSSSSE